MSNVFIAAITEVWIRDLLSQVPIDPVKSACSVLVDFPDTISLLCTNHVILFVV